MAANTTSLPQLSMAANTESLSQLSMAANTASLPQLSMAVGLQMAADDDKIFILINDNQP